MITRLEGNTGSALSEWLRSIPKYPKAFKISMRPMHEILNFNVRNLFVGEFFNNTCQKSPTRECIHGTTIDEFRKSLEFAIEIFRHKVI